MHRAQLYRYVPVLNSIIILSHVESFATNGLLQVIFETVEGEDDHAVVGALAAEPDDVAQEQRPLSSDGAADPDAAVLGPDGVARGIDDEAVDLAAAAAAAASGGDTEGLGLGHDACDLLPGRGGELDQVHHLGLVNVLVEHVERHGGLADGLLVAPEPLRADFDETVPLLGRVVHHLADLPHGLLCRQALVVLDRLCDGDAASVVLGRRRGGRRAAGAPPQ